MRILNKDELQIAEGILLKHIPKSLKVYGFLYGINRSKPSTQQVIVDSWPDFKVIICRPDPRVSSHPNGKLDNLRCAPIVLNLAFTLQKERPLKLMNKVTFYSMDDESLRKMLTEENAIDWSTSFYIGGFDISYLPMLKELASDKEVNNRCLTLVHLLYLPDSMHLLTPAVDSELESRISSLNLSHVDLVNQTWKFGGDQQGYSKIKNLISNFPSCCITDGQGQPVSWILMYEYCAVGVLYTLPEHRGKGYAKVLISTMAKRLHAQGYPVYCFIEEENEVSCRLFKNLGFIEDPSYRAGWFEFNF